MKIFYDHVIFSLQKYGGVSKYFCELLNHIPRDHWKIPILFSDNEYLRALQLMPQRNLFGAKNFLGKARLFAELGKPYTIFSALKKDFDIYHQTHFDDFLFPFLKQKPLVTTFHDINLLLYPPANIFWRNIGKQQQIAINRADRVIAISHNTKKDMLEQFNIDEKKIVVIHHGVDKQKPQALCPYRIFDFPYILYVGTRGGFKNWVNLVKAFSIVVRKNKNIRLVCTWRTFSADEMSLLRTFKVQDQVCAIAADEPAMARLYRDAEMFVFPSTSEGFGMPILEAMVYDCPVVLSNTSCFPEIAQEAGIYFNPYDIEDIADKISLVLEDSELRKKQIALGKERLTHFSWEKCANEHVCLYKSLT
jgi:glycosyltransferase involved in cell wall biosynthesis